LAIPDSHASMNGSPSGNRTTLTASARTKIGVAVAVVVLTAVVGLVDYWTGFDVSFGLFYLIPVGCAAWYLGRSAGLWLALLSSVAWLLANMLTERGGELPTVVVSWNAFTRLGFFAVVAYLLANLHAALERERALARTDHLTGANNSLAFEEALRTEMDRAKRYARQVSLIYLDLDNFKAVNDQFGHATGNRLLRSIGPVLRASLRSSDVVGRLGGDEFGILLPETGPDRAGIVAQKIRDALANEMSQKGWPVTASIGVVTCQQDVVTPDQLIAKADALMYQAKRKGKNSIQHAIMGSDAE